MTRYEERPQNFGSLENTTWAWKQKGLSAEEKLMLLCIANGLQLRWADIEEETGIKYSSLVLAGHTLLERRLASFEDGFWMMPEDRW